MIDSVKDSHRDGLGRTMLSVQRCQCRLLGVEDFQFWKRRELLTICPNDEMNELRLRLRRRRYEGEVRIFEKEVRQVEEPASSSCAFLCSRLSCVLLAAAGITNNANSASPATTDSKQINKERLAEAEKGRND